MNTAILVGASLLAIAVGQSTLMLNVMPPSRASSLPQVVCMPLQRSKISGVRHGHRHSPERGH
ncbi:hypothetical protein E3W21_13885 [Pseudomonas sp. F01002]|nr:hypothetical protein E3W21_13885 [Pseudomonas sp. F01002]